MYGSPSSGADLAARSRDLRRAVIRLHREAGAGHLGSALSIVEILVVLFERHVRLEGFADGGGAGDRLVLSKGHAAMALYCQLASMGMVRREWLESFGRSGSPLEPHPNELLVPGVHASTGSLGQGLSIGVGLALGSRLRGRDERTFVVIGDGEANEGQIWEAARCAVRLGLSNLIVVLDDNGMQQDGPTPEILPVADLVRCWREMGWACAEADGHDCAGLDAALAALRTEPGGRPRLLRATTVKGCGIPFLEGQTESHYPPPLSAEDFALVEYGLSSREGSR